MGKRFRAAPSVSIDVELSEFYDDDIISYLTDQGYKVIEPSTPNPLEIEVVVTVRTLDELSDVKDAITNLMRPGRGIKFEVNNG